MNAVEKFYFDQAGGGGEYYIGRHQRGHGIGSLFAGLFRTALPLIKPLLTRGLKAGAKAVGRHVLKRVAAKISGTTQPPRKKLKQVKRRPKKKRATATKIKRLI